MATKRVKKANPDGQLMSPVTYIGAEGPLEKACRQVFTWKLPNEMPLIVVLWHEGWESQQSYWTTLENRMRNQSDVCLTLVTYFGHSIEEFRKKEGGRFLPLLFRLLGQDPDFPRGCCSITDFERIGSAPVIYDPVNDQETLLRNKVNQILGLMT
jgi:hypothetical protein